VPLMLGGLGDFLAVCDRGERFKNYVYVNDHLRAMAQSMQNCAFVSAEGLGANPDNLHFSAAALREFGLRYYEAFKGLTPVQGEGKEANLAFSEIEKL